MAENLPLKAVGQMRESLRAGLLRDGAGIAEKTRCPRAVRASETMLTEHNPQWHPTPFLVSLYWLWELLRICLVVFIVGENSGDLLNKHCSVTKLANDATWNFQGLRVLASFVSGHKTLCREHFHDLI